MKDESAVNDPLKRTLMFAGELLVPGGSNVVKGDYKQAGIHAVLGLVAKSFLGLPGLILVSANSFSKASTGRHLAEELRGACDDEAEEAAPKPVNAPKKK
jgi:hypothetical protein